MQLVKTLSLGLLATVLWNCNGTTQPDSSASKNVDVPATVNALAKVAATGPTQTTKSSSFDIPKEAMDAMKAAGVCQGLLDLFDDLSNHPDAFKDGNVPESFKQTAMCVADKAKDLEGDAEAGEKMFNVIEECICKGSGSLWGGLQIAFSKYSRPVTSASLYSAPSSASGTPYAAPASAAGAAYSAPSSAGAEAYAAPGI